MPNVSVPPMQMEFEAAVELEREEAYLTYVIEQAESKLGRARRKYERTMQRVQRLYEINRMKEDNALGTN